jgi:hypothetical protein
MLTRRDTSLGLAALLVVASSSAKGGASARTGAVTVGRAAVKEHPHLLMADLPVRLDGAVVRADFAAGRVVKVQGWMLACHEVLWSIRQAEDQTGV